MTLEASPAAVPNSPTFFCVRQLRTSSWQAGTVQSIELAMDVQLEEVRGPREGSHEA
jgi:hypothetical protein